MQAKKAQGYTSGVWKAGQQFWGKQGIVVSLMGNLATCLYTGDPYDANTGVIVPHNAKKLPAMWAFCSSPQFNDEVRKIDQALKACQNPTPKTPPNGSLTANQPTLPPRCR
jgi:hypothetical protein